MDAAPGADAEIEWQLDAQDLAVVRRWVEKAAADGANGLTITPRQTINQVDTYLDTEDRRLDRAGYSVRLRRPRRGPTEATLKSLAGARPDALRIRRELAEEVELDDAVGLASTDGPVGRRVRALVGARRLVPLFDLQTRRRVFELAANGVPSGELLLDETSIREPAGRLLGRLRRVEVEAPETAVEAVAPLVESLRRACGLQPAALSKYESALAASGRGRAEPEELGRATIEPTDAIGQVALANLRRQFGALLAHEPGTRLGEDIEELHDMRVASRRLRAAVALFEDVLPAEAARLRPELAWLGRTIGAVRDLDVQLAQLEEWLEEVPEPDREPLARLRALLTEERARARATMLEALDSKRYERLIRRFGAMLRSRSGARTPPARGAAPELVERRQAAVRKAIKRIDPDADATEYHRLRIACKRFRYALEFLSDIYPDETKRLVKQAVALQDLLGDYQDAHVAIARLRDLATAGHAKLEPATVFAMGEVAQRYRSAMEEIRGRVTDTCSPLVGKRWKRFRKRMEAARHAVPPSPQPLTG
ncbi:MAG TPA: CHAD domain-containing protein [Gaiellaceae bacterium]